MLPVDTRGIHYKYAMRRVRTPLREKRPPDRPASGADVVSSASGDKEGAGWTPLRQPSLRPCQNFLIGGRGLGSGVPERAFFDGAIVGPVLVNHVTALVKVVAGASGDLLKV